MTRPTGAVLPLVLLGLLLVAAASFAMSFKVTLDTMAARSALEAARARAQATGALALAVAEQLSAFVAGEAEPTFHGPWPQHDILATVSVTSAGSVVLPTADPAPPAGPDSTADADAPLLMLTATATVGRATATASVTLYLRPRLGVVARR